MIESALAALADAGLSFDRIVADGRFHRGRGRQDAEWYIASAGTTAKGRSWLMISAGDFRISGGEAKALVVWKSWDSGDLTRAELGEIKHQHREARRAEGERIAQERESARLRACDLWHAAGPGPHPYLVRKRLPPFNTRVHGAALLVPMFTVEGDLVSLQKILPSGRKTNLPGGRAGGVYHSVDFLFRRDQPKVYIAEGWATAAAIRHVKGHPAVATFSAGNLTPVAKDIRRDAPELEIVIAADHDEAGLYHANKAAMACGGRVIVPPRVRDDWWDHFSQEGAL
jgi:putative DNA primase/helicase